jgi:hypothetical protein
MEGAWVLARPGLAACCVDQLIAPLTYNLIIRKDFRGSPGTFIYLGLVFIPINQSTAVDGLGMPIMLHVDWLMAWLATAIVEIWYNN